MLILSRKVDEEIIIGGNIRIMVVSVDGHDRVSLGVEAPSGVAIVRKEIIGTGRDKPVGGRGR